MLIDFQQAFADLIASPELCRRVRADAAVLDASYRLSQRESSRLVAIARDRGMRCNCMLYRANRLAPIAMNLPELCAALGPRLAPLLHDYWERHAGVNAHFLLESRAFCQYLASDALAREPLLARVQELVVRALGDLDARIAASLA